MWSAAAGSDGSDWAMANLSVLFLTGGCRAAVFLSYQPAFGTEHIFLQGRIGTRPRTQQHDIQLIAAQIRTTWVLYILTPMPPIQRDPT